MDQDGHFGTDIAQRYDEDHGRTDPLVIEQSVSCLVDLAGAGRALEFAVGTGRIALPLAARGVEVHGVELSQAMVAELRKKEGGLTLPVVVGDMCSARAEGEFSLVFLVFNTITNLTSQDAQVACFENAARHLEPGGRFVIETQVPPVQRLPYGETKYAFDVSDTHIGVDEIDIVTQRCASHHVWTDARAQRTFSLPFRYVWPSELDLMARIAGLRREHRWADWTKAPFDHLSESHVSVWIKDET